MACFPLSRSHLIGAVLISSILAFFFPSASEQRQIEKTVLRFAPAAGARLDYNILGMVSMSGENPLGKDLSLTAVTQGVLHFAVLTSTRDAVRARLTSPGIEVRVQVPDRTLSEMLSTREGQALEVAFNETGRIKEIRNPDALSQGRILNFSLPQILTDCFPVLSAEPVSPGRGWSESRRMAIPFEGFELLVHLKTDYVLNDVVPFGQDRQALITTFFSVTVSGRRDLGDLVGVFEGRGTGTGFLHFLVGRSVFTEYKIDFKTDAAFVVKRGEERLYEWPFAFSVSVYVAMANRAGF